MRNSPILLLLGEMARRLGVETSWLRDEADANRVPCIKAGKRYLFAPDAVERALALRASGEVIDLSGGAA
jgi:hypothetical protein